MAKSNHEFDGIRSVEVDAQYLSDILWSHLGKYKSNSCPDSHCKSLLIINH